MNEVVIGAPYIVTDELMKQMNVDVVCHGLTPTQCDEKNRDPYEIPKKLDKFVLVDSENDMTTRKIVERIIENRLKYEERNRRKEKQS